MFSHLKVGDKVFVVSYDNCSIETVSHVNKHHIRVSNGVMKYRRTDGSTVGVSVRNLKLIK